MESEKYAIEIERLKSDPIILEMYKDIASDSINMESWNFMAAASDEYFDRGGRNVSIGGPAKALAELHAEKCVCDSGTCECGS